MSEFVLSYFEINNSKYKIKNVSRKMESYANKIRREANRLDGQRGFGTGQIQSRLYGLSRKFEGEREKLLLLHDFLDDVAEKTKEADRNAARILEDFSVRRVENILHGLTEDFTSFMGVAIKLLGIAAAGDSFAEWIFDIADTGNKIMSGDGLLDLGIDFFWDSLKEGIKTIGPGKFAGKGSVVSWFVDWVEDGLENFTDGEGNFRSDLWETFTEGGLGGVLLGAGLLLGGALAAAVGAEGAAAAIVVSATYTVVKWAADLISNEIFDNDLGFVENLGNVLCDWFGELGVEY